MTEIEEQHQQSSYLYHPHPNTRLLYMWSTTHRIHNYVKLKIGLEDNIPLLLRSIMVDEDKNPIWENVISGYCSGHIDKIQTFSSCATRVLVSTFTSIYLPTGNKRKLLFFTNNYLIRLSILRKLKGLPETWIY